MATAKLRKQTAANNTFLADVKHWCNKPTFKMATAMVNGAIGPAAGEARMREYLLANVFRSLDFLPTRAY